MRAQISLPLARSHSRPCSICTFGFLFTFDFFHSHSILPSQASIHPKISFALVHSPYFVLACISNVFTSSLLCHSLGVHLALVRSTLIERFKFCHICVSVYVPKRVRVLLLAERPLLTSTIIMIYSMPKLKLPFCYLPNKIAFTVIHNLSLSVSLLLSRMQLKR